MRSTDVQWAGHASLYKETVHRVTVHHHGDFSGNVLIDSKADAVDLGQPLFSIEAISPTVIETSVPFAIMPNLVNAWLIDLAEQALENNEFGRLTNLSIAIAAIQNELGTM